MKILVPPFRALVPALVAFVLLPGCGKEEAKAPPQRPPVDVTVMTVTARDTPVSFEFVGQTQSSREVEIRARVDGFLEKRLYVEGDVVPEAHRHVPARRRDAPRPASAETMFTCALTAERRICVED